MTTPYEVWIVEDQEYFRDSVVEVLSEAPGLISTYQFGSAEEFLHLVGEGALPDAVLMDIELPGMDGISCVRELKQIAPRVEVVMLTIHHDNDRIFEAVCAGASGYLLKTATPDQIVEALYQVREGGAPMDARTARRVLEMFRREALPESDYGLSEREVEILRGLVDGLTKKEIGERLFISPHTVDNHVRNVYEKLHVHTRTAAVAAAIRGKLV